MIYAIGLLVIACAWLLPGHYFPWTGFQQELAAAAGGLLVATAVAAHPQAGRRVGVPRIAAFFCILAAVPLTQWAAGRVGYLADALLPALYLMALALAIVVGRQMATYSDDRFTLGLMLAVLAAALASWGIGLAQWLQATDSGLVEHMVRGDRVYANFTQPNHLASLLGMGVVSAIWLYETRRIGHLALWLALATLALGIAMTRSRTGWAIVAALLAWWLVAHGRAGLRSTWNGAAGAVIVFTSASLLWGPLNQLLDVPTTTIAGDRLQSVGGRAIHWPALWDAAWLRPWFGWGWLQVSPAQQAVALDHPRSYEWITYSHNFVLDVLVWNGILIGGLVLAAFGAWVIKRAWRCRDETSWSMLAVVTVVLVHAQLEFPHAYLYFLIPLGLCIGVLESRALPDTEALPWKLPRTAVVASITLLAAFAAKVAAEYLDVEEAARRARFYEAGYVVGSDKPYVPDVTLLDSQREFLWFRLTEARPGMDPADLERMRSVSQRFAPPAALLRYALAAGLNGQPEVAQRSLALICQMWTKRNCDEAQVSWTELRKRFAQLDAIEFPKAAGAASMRQHPS